jgi:membrane protein YdbS with pleckstrin-like domain
MYPTAKPSQWINIGWLIAAIIILIKFNSFQLWGIGIGWFALGGYLIKCLEVYYWRYEFEWDKLCERKGIFTVKREYAQYYRIKSIMIEQPIALRIVGLSNIHVITSEQFKPNIKLYAVKNGMEIKDYLDNAVLKQKLEHNVHEVDMFNSNK